MPSAVSAASANKASKHFGPFKDSAYAHFNVEQRIDRNHRSAALVKP